MLRTRTSRSLLAGALGVGAGAAYAAVRILWRHRRERPHLDPALERLETQTVDALCADPVTGRCAIDVAALGPGVIELSGSVPDEDAGNRAADVTQRVPGVVTVVNRLRVEVLERHLEETRRRHYEGDASLQAAGWEGTRAGMGSRRQGAETDPSRRDDAADLRTDAIRSDEPAS
jgi:hypothetical protein